MLAKKYRLNGEREFRRVYSKGRYLTGKLVTIKYFFAIHQTLPKIGIVVSKKISNKSSVRNKIKRQISEVIFKSLPKLPDQIKMVIIVKKIPENFQGLKTEINQLLNNV